jgi:RNA polymerase sigma-70 factor (ECF subfamily)
MQKTALDNETELLDGLRKGSEHCYSALFTTLYPVLCYYALQYTGEQSVSEDIAEEAFIKIWNRRGDFFHFNELKSFLYLTVRNASIDWLRKNKRDAERQKGWNGILDGSEKNAFDMLVEAEVFRELHVAIDKLPQQTRKIITMSYFEGKKNKEVADELGISVSTVKNLKAWGLKKLKNNLPLSVFSLLSLLQAYP